MVTEDAAGAAVLLTVVLLFVVSALANGACPASSPSADAAAKELLGFAKNRLNKFYQYGRPLRLILQRQGRSPEACFECFLILFAGVWGEKHAKGFLEIKGAFLAEYSPKPSHLDMLHINF